MYALGLELSTQSAKSLVLDVASGRVEHLAAHEYDACLPGYGTQGGVLVSSDPEVRHASPFLLIEALDLLFARMQKDGVDLGRVRALKADGMQHCTVYTNRRFPLLLEALDPARNLLDPLRDGLSRPTAPIWEDRSTGREAAYLAEALRPHGGIEVLTGNRAELRFPAAQILKWGSADPGGLDRTDRIHLLSAFITSLLCGRSAAVDTGDGWGTNMNHRDIRNPGWCAPVLAAMDRYLRGRGVRTNLEPKLGRMVAYDTPAGRIHPYFSARYGVHPEAIVLAGTGDNPATLLGCGSGTVVSLGTSYTVNGVSREPAPSPSGEYNLFGYVPGKTMALSVFTNGSKVHDHFLRRYLLRDADRKITNRDWEAYVRAAGPPMLREDEPLMLPYLYSESVPLRPRGIVRQGFDDKEADRNIRALCVSQALSLRLHSTHLHRPGSICVVGGGARNPFLVQILADLFQAETYNIRHADFAAPLGCAVSGARWLLNLSYEEAARRYVQRDPASCRLPNPGAVLVAERLIDRYRDLEEQGRL